MQSRTLTCILIDDSSPDRSADNTRPEHGSKPVHDDVFDSPLKVKLAEGCNSHRIWIVSPHAWRGLALALLRQILGRKGIRIGHKDR